MPVEESMKIEMGKIPIRIALDSPSVGDVYRAKGGRGETRFFAIVSIVGNTAHALGLNSSGDIVSTTSYGTHVFASRDIVGRINGLTEMRLEIEWEPV
jgi:hypothetical protein